MQFLIASKFFWVILNNYLGTRSVKHKNEGTSKRRPKQRAIHPNFLSNKKKKKAKLIKNQNGKREQNKFPILFFSMGFPLPPCFLSLIFFFLF